jgi:predicted component of type VI protein secretion system
MRSARRMSGLLRASRLCVKHMMEKKAVPPHSLYQEFYTATGWLKSAFRETSAAGSRSERSMKPPP